MVSETVILRYQQRCFRDYATSVGLILYGFSVWQDRGLSRDKKKGSWTRVKDWFKEG